MKKNLFGALSAYNKQQSGLEVSCTDAFHEGCMVMIIEKLFCTSFNRAIWVGIYFIISINE